MKDKKAAHEIVFLLIFMVASLVALALYLGVFTKFFGEGFTNIRKEIFLTGDCDEDNVMNRLDECPCDKIDRGTPTNQGCSEGYKITGKNVGKEDRSCLTDDKLCPIKKS